MIHDSRFRILPCLALMIASFGSGIKAAEAGERAAPTTERGSEASAGQAPSLEAGPAPLELLEATSSPIPRGTIVTFDTAAMTERIRKADAATRPTMLKLVGANLEATETALAQLRRAGRDLKSEGRTRFNAAYDEVRNRESALRQAAREVRHAEGNSLGEALANLASAYSGYAESFVRVETTLRQSGVPAGSH